MTASSESLSAQRIADIEAGQRVIRLEAQALSALAEGLGPAFAEAVERIVSAKGRLVAAGIGKSGHVARKIAASMASTGTPAMFVHPTEASHGDLGMIGSEDVVLALSKSGETSELSDLVHHTRRFGVGLVAMTTGAQSTLARAADVALILPDIAEACDETRAPTTSTTMMMALGDALAVALLERRGFTATDFRMFHPGGKLGAMLRAVCDLMHKEAAMPLVPLGTIMRDAILVMTAGRLGLCGVVDQQGALVGVVTDGDLRRNMSIDLFDRPVDALMSRQPRTIHPDALASDALRRINEAKITALFVVGPDKVPVGVVHLHDLLRAGVA